LTLREGNRRALRQRFEQLEPGSHVDLISKIEQPTLILWGGRDRLIPRAVGDRLKEEIENSRMVVWDALGHVPQEEDPAATVAPVADFLLNFENGSNSETQADKDDAELRFQRDEDGSVTALVLKQGAINQRAARINE
ncbi:MAG: alpha/beta hydrolase, partial [Rhodothermales bacterium]|nr:alpha/beta hydrolase [Rhodothermales bacterium]